LVALFAAGPAAASATWSIVPTPNPSGYGPVLLGAAADATNDAWGVGAVFDPPTSTYRNLAEHWNGASWAITPTPNPLKNQQLNGVAATSPTNAWAVGFANNSTWGANRTVIARWNGTRWSTVPSPNPSAGENDLWGVWAASATDAWAVGFYSTSTGGQKTLAEHWNGTSWSVVPTPNASTYNNFHRVFGTSSSDVWAVGTAYNQSNNVSAPLVEHWNGSSWKVVSIPVLGDTYLRGGWATSRSDAWIVGEKTGPAPDYDESPLVYHWNGTSWKSVASPSGDLDLWGVAAKTPTDAWIVGTRYDSRTNAYLTLIEHWNGTSWSVNPSPNRTTASGAINELNAVTILPGGLTWALGDSTGPGAGTLALRTLGG
jgi:hypothetical protein